MASDKVELRGLCPDDWHLIWPELEPATATEAQEAAE